MSIPAHISASRALAREEQYVGRIDSVRLDRLADFSPQDIEAELSFRFDAARFKRVEGRVKGQLSLECQVCLQSYDWQLDAPISLVIVESEDEEARVLADSDPVMVEDDRLMMHQMVEDEVLLALPLLRRCPTCDNTRRQNAAEDVDAVSDETHRPLAALKNLSLKGK